MHELGPFTFDREKFYTGIKSDPSLHVKLTGSWEVVVGENDMFGVTNRKFNWLCSSDILKS